MLVRPLICKTLVLWLYKIFLRYQGGVLHAIPQEVIGLSIIGPLAGGI